MRLTIFFSCLTSSKVFHWCLSQVRILLICTTLLCSRHTHTLVLVLVTWFCFTWAETIGANAQREEWTEWMQEYRKWNRAMRSWPLSRPTLLDDGRKKVVVFGMAQQHRVVWRDTRHLCRRVERLCLYYVSPRSPVLLLFCLFWRLPFGLQLCNYEIHAMDTRRPYAFT